MTDRVSFGRSLYDPAAVDAAVAAYAHLATFEVAPSEEAVDVTVHVAANVPWADRLVDAFCNHVLVETVARLRARSAP